MSDKEKRTAKMWAEYEEQLLKDNYPSGTLNSRELADLLGRTEASVKRKLYALGLTLIQEEIPEGYHRCSRCRTIQPIENFASSVNRHKGLDTYCSVCVSIKAKERKSRYKAEGYNTPEFITCTICGETKPSSEYYNLALSPTGKYKQCKVCCSERAKRDRVLKKETKLKKESL